MSKTTDYATLPHMPRVYQFARQEQTIRRLQTELDAANDRIVELKIDFQLAIDDATELQGEIGALLLWAQAAYARVNALMTIGVSMTPDAVTAKLLEDAPEGVKGGAKS